MMRFFGSFLQKRTSASSCKKKQKLPFRKRP
jgi:hypothetical protein